MKWIKYRHKTSADVSKWEYEDVSHCEEKGIVNKTYLKESVVERIEDDYGDFEKYYGIEYEIIDYPPLEIMEQEISSMKGQIVYLSDEIIKYGLHIGKIKAETN